MPYQCDVPHAGASSAYFLLSALMTNAAAVSLPCFIRKEHHPILWSGEATKPTLAPGVPTSLLAQLLGCGPPTSSAGVVARLGTAMGPPLPFKHCTVCLCCCCCLQGQLPLLRELALRRGHLFHREPGRIACPACGVHHNSQRKAALARLLHLDELLGRPLQHAARSASQTPVPRTACWCMQPKDKVNKGDELVMLAMSAAMPIHQNGWVQGLAEPGEAGGIPGPAALLAPGLTP